MNLQRTLAKSISFSGIGLHSGKPIHCELRPSRPDTGIVFILEMNGGIRSRIPARYKNVGALSYNTGLRAENGEILTVEHLLSALHGYGIDNCEVWVDNTEIPVMDGSAAPFILLLCEAGIVRQDAPRRTVRLTRPVRVGDDNMWIEAEPSDDDTLSIEYTIDFDHPSIGRMTASFSDDPYRFAHAVAPARTFGFLREVEVLRARGLIRGANLQNAVVMDDHRIISGETRFQDEFVRHKILDFWGDIVLLGHPLVAKIKAFRAGHRLHAQLVETLLKTPDLLVPVDQTIRHRILQWASSGNQPVRETVQ
ncbi:UDP-3-O-[3-hydroxymyristoyl] N-acetylglucosamine deacetylase [bacterium]|nr:UDP-3-O-[3-hydroxymyristoyl] N-acetylglucosamine deacetylase [candidate division CSSED10-310 bacterium]